MNMGIDSSCVSTIIFLGLVALLLLAATRSNKKKNTGDSVVTFSPSCVGGGVQLVGKRSFENQSHFEIDVSEARVLSSSSSESSSDEAR